MGLISEFKEFAVKGNMVDMAVGIIIGAAFGTVIASLVADIIMPLVSGLVGLPDFSNSFVLLKEPVGEAINMESLEDVRKNGGVALAWGLFINKLISFLMVTFAIWVVIRNINKMKKAEAAAPAAPAAPPAEEVLLTEIRDLLAKR